MTGSKTSKSFKQWLCMGAAAVLSIGTLSAVTPSLAYAQDSAPVEGRQFGAKAGEKVLEAQNMMTTNQFSAALSKLNESLQITDLNAYERSTISQMQGACYYELNQYGQAISAFENAINAGGLLPNEQDNLRVNIAQLLIGDGKYAQGAQMLENWIKSRWPGQAYPCWKC